LAYQPQSRIKLDGLSDKRVLFDLAINPLQIIVKSEEVRDEFLPYPIEKNSRPLLPDPKETIPSMDKVMVAKVNIPEELTGVQRVLEVKIPRFQGVH
jgi:hypothetical protein